MSGVDAGDVLEVALRTLLVCGSALFLASALGLPLGIFLGQRRFAGRGLAVSLVNAGMGAPPIVVGLLVALTLWRTGPLGPSVRGTAGTQGSPRPAGIDQIAEHEPTEYRYCRLHDHF